MALKNDLINMKVTEGDQREKIINYISKSFNTRIKASTMNGVGVFAIKKIPEGAEILKYFDISEPTCIILEDDEFEIFTPEQKEMFNDYYYFYEGKHRIVLFPNEIQMLQRYINYSKDNFNCTLNNMKVVSTREIQIGEELLLDINAPLSEPFSNLFKEKFEK